MKTFQELEIGNKIWLVYTGGEFKELMVENKSETFLTVSNSSGGCFQIHLNKDEKNQTFINRGKSYIGTDLKQVHDRCHEIFSDDFETLISDIVSTYYKRLKTLNEQYENLQRT